MIHKLKLALTIAPIFLTSPQVALAQTSTDALTLFAKQNPGGLVGSISSASFMGAAGATSAEIAPGPDQVAEQPQAYVYSTQFSELIKPELVINGFSGETGGKWTATQSVDELNQIYYDHGKYGVISGKFSGQFSGNTFSGKYTEEFVNDGLQGACDKKIDGTFYYGTLILEFSADRSSFRAKKIACYGDPSDGYWEWEGKLTGRTAPVVTGPGG